MNPRNLVGSALSLAQAQADEGDSPSLVHRSRSRHFVEALAGEFRTHYALQPSIRVLSKHFPGHRADFGLNELLFDVLVCDTSTVRSATDSATLVFVTRGLWAVESEFARDTRQAIFDFNKLVLASTDYKLFVGPQVADQSAFLEPLLPPAGKCGGEVFIALVPHPSEWTTGRSDVDVFQLRQTVWQAL